MQILCTSSWSWPTCLFCMTVCSGPLLKPARRCWRFISDKFKSQLNSEGLKVKFLCNGCKYWFSLQTSLAPEKGRITLEADHCLHHKSSFLGKKMETFGGENSRDKVSLKHRLLRITFWQVLIKEKHSLPVAAYVSWIILCNLITICQQHFSWNNAWPWCIDPLAWPG